MPREKRFDKKTATTYALVHRPQNDPLSYDSSAPQQILTEISSKPVKAVKIKTRRDLEEEFGTKSSVRLNEGEAAEHGIFFDDSRYDYMQHLRELGENSDATWIEATSREKGKGRAKQSLEDMIRDFGLDNDSKSTTQGRTVSPARAVSRPTWAAQEDVPHEIAGFQPDLDPRLREVLDALEDEAYVDDEDDIFQELTRHGHEVSRDEWDASDSLERDDEEGWESDATQKGPQARDVLKAEVSIGDQIDPSFGSSIIPPPTKDAEDFMAEFARSKGTKGDLSRRQISKPANSSVLSSSTHYTKGKRRKGALTSSTGFSMTSSVLARSEALSILDARFDKIAETYMDDDDEGASVMSAFSGMTGLSKASGFSKTSAWGESQASESPYLMPAKFDAVLDDFLGRNSGGRAGKTKYRPMRKAGLQGQWAKDAGLQQLDEIRSGLGPARINRRDPARSME